MHLIVGLPVPGEQDWRALYREQEARLRQAERDEAAADDGAKKRAAERWTRMQKSSLQTIREAMRARGFEVV